MPEESVVKAEKNVEKPVKLQKKTRTFLNKVVIRKLPPNLTSETFMQTIEPIPEYNDFYFVSADYSLGVEATSRAYIEFKNQEDVSKFIINPKLNFNILIIFISLTDLPFQRKI